MSTTSIEEQITQYTLSQLEAFGAFGLVLLVIVIGSAAGFWLLFRVIQRLEVANDDLKAENQAKDAHIQKLNEDFRDSATESTKAITKFNDTVPALLKRS